MDFFAFIQKHFYTNAFSNVLDMCTFCNVYFSIPVYLLHKYKQTTKLCF